MDEKISVLDKETIKDMIDTFYSQWNVYFKLNFFVKYIMIKHKLKKI